VADISPPLRSLFMLDTRSYRRPNGENGQTAYGPVADVDKLTAVAISDGAWSKGHEHRRGTLVPCRFASAAHLPIAIARVAPACPIPRDFVPWRFSDADHSLLPSAPQPAQSTKAECPVS
jgi:hypothetical protein